MCNAGDNSKADDDGRMLATNRAVVCCVWALEPTAWVPALALPLSQGGLGHFSGNFWGPHLLLLYDEDEGSPALGGL